ncbi:MAG: T9SS type A sorting domain-containing protein [Bacteroidota bacterium]
MKKSIFFPAFFLMNVILCAQQPISIAISPTTLAIVNSTVSGFNPVGIYNIGRKDGSFDNGQNIYHTAYFFDLSPYQIPRDANVSSISLDISVFNYEKSSYSARITAVPSNITPYSPYKDIYNAVGGGTTYFDNLNYASAPFLSKTSPSLTSVVKNAISTQTIVNLGALCISENSDGSEAGVVLVLNITYTPGHFTCIFKNSFNSGNLMVDGTSFSSGSSFNLSTGSTHPIAAVDHQYIQDASNGKWYYRDYQNWSDPTGYTIVTKPQTAFALKVTQGGTWTANFLKEFNLTFMTSFGGGTVTVNNTSYPSGYQQILLERGSVSFSAPSFIRNLNGYDYSLNNWTGNGTVVSSPDIPTDHTQYVANFTKTLSSPTSFGGSTITDNAGTHPLLSWSSSDVAAEVIGYHIFRQYGNATSFSLVGIVNGRNTTSWSDKNISVNVSNCVPILYAITAFTSSMESPLENSRVLKYLGLRILLSEHSGNLVMQSTIAEEIPQTAELYQNYPNPFNPTTKISFAMPSAAYVKISVCDVLGREVETLIDCECPAGYHSVEFDGSKLSSGMYFYKLQAGSFTEIKKMQLIK